MLALCRLARFESNESLSKSAALYLMEAVAKSPPEPTLTPSILLTIEKDQRRAARWLRTLTEDMQGSATQTDAWKAFAADEAIDAAKLQEANEGRRPIAESNVGALRFNNWVGKWLTKRVDRQQALEAVKQSLGLVANNPYACLEYTKWALDAQLPELVVELSNKHAEIFQLEPQLGFLLAECHLRAGNPEAAEAQAEQASQQIQKLAEKVTPIAATMNVNDIVANRRTLIAKDLLVERGMFDWAEREFKLAVDLETSLRIEVLARSTFGEFYWSGGEYQKAADSLRPLFDDPNAAKESGLPGRASELSYVAPYFYFYEGLAETQRKNFERASEMLVKAFEAGEPSPAGNNPDIVIAMKQIADNEDRQQVFEMYFDAMVQDFRASVITSEQVLAESPDRRTRDYLSVELANNCNQLAWLLSRCEVPGEEAVNLSRRSLEFYPNQPAYLDTLGRCYFTAGKIGEAIKMQERALVASPHDRQMKAQLAEFKAALAAQETASGVSGDKPRSDDHE
jgi:tetratricopeptide (TPR) repeat protein